MNDNKLNYVAIETNNKQVNKNFINNFEDIVLDNPSLTATQMCQLAKHIANVKSKNFTQEYMIVNILSLFNGSERDFADLQRGLGINAEPITRVEFYKQLVDKVEKSNEIMITHPFVAYVYSQTKPLTKRVKTWKAPSVIDFLSAIQKDRANRDENLAKEDMRFTRREAVERNLIIRKGIRPFEGKGRKATFDTITAVPKYFLVHDDVLKGYPYKNRWDSPFIRSRKTAWNLFSREADEFPKMDEELNKLGALYGVKVKTIDQLHITEERNAPGNLFKYETNEIYDAKYDNKKGIIPNENNTLYLNRYRRNYSLCSNFKPAPIPIYNGSEVWRVRVNPYEHFAEVQKALLVRDYQRSTGGSNVIKKEIKNIANIISQNGGTNSKKRAKMYYSYIVDVAGMMATRNAMYAYDFDKDIKYRDNAKRVSWCLDEGLEFQYGNKLAAFWELKATWLLPAVQSLANKMTYDFYKRKGVSPVQIAEGMRRVNVKPGLVRNVPAEDAKEDDYAMVLYNTIEDIGDFDLAYGNIEEKASTRTKEIPEVEIDDEDFDIFKIIQDKKDSGEWSSMVQDKTQEIEDKNQKRNEIASGLQQKTIAEGVTTEKIMIDADKEDEIDQVIEGNKKAEDISQEFIDKTATEQTVYEENVLANMSKDPTFYVDTKGNVYLSKTEMESNRKIIEEGKITIPEKIDSSKQTIFKETEKIVSTSKNINLPINIEKKIRKYMFQKFNSDFHKLKLKLDDKLEKKLASTAGKKVTKATQDAIDKLYSDREFMEELIFSNIECIPELARINKFGKSGILSNAELIKKSLSTDAETRKIGTVQKEMVTLVNQSVVGVIEMLSKNPQECSGKSITQLLSVLREKTKLDEKVYINQVLNDVIIDKYLSKKNNQQKDINKER